MRGRNPGKVRVSNNGTGSVWHLCAAMFEQAAGIKLTHVPFQGGKAAAVAMLGGHVEVSSSALGEISEFVKGERQKFLAYRVKKGFQCSRMSLLLKSKGLTLK